MPPSPRQIDPRDGPAAADALIGPPSYWVRRSLWLLFALFLGLLVWVLTTDVETVISARGLLRAGGDPAWLVEAHVPEGTARELDRRTGAEVRLELAATGDRRVGLLSGRLLRVDPRVTVDPVAGRVLAIWISVDATTAPPELKEGQPVEVRIVHGSQPLSTLVLRSLS